MQLLSIDQRKEILRAALEKFDEDELYMYGPAAIGDQHIYSNWYWSEQDNAYETCYIMVHPSGSHTFMPNFDLFMNYLDRRYARGVLGEKTKVTSIIALGGFALVAMILIYGVTTSDAQLMEKAAWFVGVFVSGILAFYFAFSAWRPNQ